MRVVAVLFGMLFMLLGAATIAFSFAYMHDSGTADAGVRCVPGTTETTCQVNDSVQDQIIDASLANSFQIIGATLFVSGSVLNAGAVAAGRRH